jgi:23S rRNA (adenine2503-C2)-methyltransferase
VPGPYDLSRPDLDELLAGWGEPRYRADQVWKGLYEQLVPVGELTSLPRALRQRLAADLHPLLTEVVERVSDGGDTVKWLWRLEGGATVETVLMRYPERDTACVSSQAGCAMACGFCATGQAGFERHLTPGEIVEQVVVALRRARGEGGRRSLNVVFMGMGEPFANYENTWTAVERLHDDLGIGARNITLSTVGILPGIRRLAGERLPVNLAVSLHAATDELRDELVPINKRYPLADLEAACTTYLAAKGRRLSFEWALIDGVNDGADQARALADLCRRLPLPAHVNLIPLNPTPGYPVRGTPAAGVRAFRDRLRERGVNVTVRRTRGVDIEAACGQLRAGHEARELRRTRTVAAPTRRSARSDDGQRTSTVRPSA